MGKVLSFQKHRRRRPSSWRAWRWALPAAAVVLVLAGYQVPPSKMSMQQVQAASSAFSLCGAPPHHDCVIDGDTFYLGRQSIRIADIDTPETRGARCAYEATLGDRATHRLHALLNAGPFQLQAGARDADRYGRKLRTVMRDGRSLGDVLVTEGLARPWTGRRLPWCSS